MRAFSWLLVITAAAIGPLWHDRHVAGQLDPTLLRWVQWTYDALRKINVSTSSGCPVMLSVERNGTCVPLDMAAELQRAGHLKSAGWRMMPAPPSLDDLLYQALKSGRLCDIIPADACANETRRFSSDQWHDPWWSWLEFYGGRVSCVDKGIRRTGQCIFGSWSGSNASCFVRFSKIRTSYRWRVAAATNTQHGGPLAVVEAGNASATVEDAQATLYTSKESDDRFHIVALNLGSVRMKNLVVENPTVGWHGKTIDTMERRFRDLFLNALSDLAHDFITNVFFDRLKKALIDLQD